MQYHLSRYAFLCESIVLQEGTTLTPTEENGNDLLTTIHVFADQLVRIAAPGLRASLEAIDNRSDFKTYMQNYAFAHGGANSRGPRRDGPRDEGFVGFR